VARLLLTESLRERLKAPLGRLISGTSSECNQALKRVFEVERPQMLILVGDTISRNAVQFGIRPDVIVIDQRELRGEAVEFNHEKKHVFRAINEPATINLLAWQAISEAVERRDAVVIIDGEEDLLALVAILAAPIGSIVAYGQPGSGIVVVRISDAEKEEISALVHQMIKAD
jgi:GTP-dependent dephospho-CoA kinase